MKGLILRESPYKPAKLEKREKNQQQHSDNTLIKNLWLTLSHESSKCWKIEILDI